MPSSKIEQHATKSLPKPIKCLQQRNITYCKRKRGLLKKIIELSSLCEQHVFLVLFDNAKERLVEYNSSDSFNIDTLRVFLKTSMLENFAYERYTNLDYSIFKRQSTDYRNPKSHKRNKIVDWVKHANSKVGSAESVVPRKAKLIFKVEKQALNKEYNSNSGAAKNVSN